MQTVHIYELEENGDQDDVSPSNDASLGERRNIRLHPDSIPEVPIGAFLFREAVSFVPAVSSNHNIDGFYQLISTKFKLLSNRGLNLFSY